MRIFVDELPKDCASCKHYHMNCADGYSCSKLRKEIHPNFSEGIGYRHQDCPLQSLADHDKQVRKDVCEKIKNLGEPFPWSEPYMWIISQKDLDNILEEYKEK